MAVTTLNQGMTIYAHLKQLVEHQTLDDPMVSQYRQQLSDVTDSAKDIDVTSAEGQFWTGLQQNIERMLDAPEHQSIFLTRVNDDGSFVPFEITNEEMQRLRAQDLVLYNTYQDNAFIYQQKTLDGASALALFKQQPWRAV